MGDSIYDRRGFSTSRSAFILYRPAAESENEVLSYNEEARHILALSLPDCNEGGDFSAGICSF